MTTYAIRREQYADYGDDQPDAPMSYYVYTITRYGYTHTFASGQGRKGSKLFAADLAKLKPATIAAMVGDTP